ncbi:MAG: hypothetical protein Q8881_02995, partial [Sweet potato little leaf phytoplasma]|nr:hypothetical protein [Sweet potato little leaf phytoplasma]
ETAEFLGNFAFGDVSDGTVESIPPNFPQEDFSDKTAEFPPNFALGDVSSQMADFCRISHSELFPTKWPNFRRISHL